MRSLKRLWIYLPLAVLTLFFLWGIAWFFSDAHISDAPMSFLSPLIGTIGERAFCVLAILGLLGLPIYGAVWGIRVDRSRRSPDHKISKYALASATLSLLGFAALANFVQPTVRGIGVGEAAFFAIAGVFCGYRGLREIKKEPEIVYGKRIALIGLIGCYTFIGLFACGAATMLLQRNW